MARSSFDDAKDYRGGRVSADDDTPKRVRYACFAEHCPMPGTLFPDHGKNGVCAWHYGIVPSDIPKVTRVLLDWQCVSDEVNAARVVLCGDQAADPKAQADALAAAWSRLKPLVAGWDDQLQPGTIHTAKGADTGFRQGYGDWAKHLERFLGARVVEVLSVHQRRAA